MLSEDVAQVDEADVECQGEVEESRQERSWSERSLLHKICTPKSNVILLGIVFVLFGSFAVTEMIFAVVANSLSLLGDAASMIVDSFTYVMNMIAERKKSKGVSEKTRLRLELFIPLVSVIFLTVPTIYVIVQAVQTIGSPPNPPTTQDEIMLIFSIMNLVIDVVSIFCFARLNRLLGYAVREELLSETLTGEQEEQKSNTNMCSAYTHVLADTLRSIAVLAAATASRSNDHINPDVADAWAAIAVSIIIFLSLLPLLRGLSQKFSQLRHLNHNN